MFIHPAKKDPELFIGFRKEIPFAKGGSRRGAVTIKALGLDRPALNERRRDYYECLKHIYVLASLNIPESADARAYLNRAIRSDAEYAAMARAAVAADFGI